MGVHYLDQRKNIVILGGSYGGLRAARVLAELLDHPEYRIIVIDRNSHMNHLYVLPRYSILPDHELKAFIPYTRIFTEKEEQHQIIHATILSMTRNSVTVSYALPNSPNTSGVSAVSYDEAGRQETIPFEYAIYALGASLPDPINVWKPLETPHLVHTQRDPRQGPKLDASKPSSVSWLKSAIYALAASLLDLVNVWKPLETPRLVPSEGRDSRHGPKLDGFKPSSVSWLKTAQGRVQNCESVIVVGGGALGIQIASDIAAVYPTKRVTLMHSRDRLLPLYNPQVHDLIIDFLAGLNVSVVLNSRLSSESMQTETRDERGQRVLRTVSGEEFRADMVFLCTGSKGNVEILATGLGENCVNPNNGLVRVLRTLQVDPLPSTRLQAGQEEHISETLAKSSFAHIFAIGDSADAFGAIKAGHTAYFQGEVAARNIASLIKSGEAAVLDAYVPGPPAIKVSVGLKNQVTQNPTSVYASDDGKDDLEAARMWQMLGQENLDFNL